MNSVSLNYKNNIPSEVKGGYFFLGENDRLNLLNAFSDGMFVININTHIVYYTKGVVSDGVTYYTTGQSAKIPTFTANVVDTPVTDAINEAYKNDDESDMITITFDANGGSGVPGDLKIKRPDMPATQAERGNTFLVRYLRRDINGVVPVKPGYKFYGWSQNPNDSLPKYRYMGGQTVYDTPNGDISLAEYMQPELKLYAIWTQDTSTNVIKAYYQDGIGGLKPTVNRNSVSRFGDIPESVERYLCFDIPTSGYIVKWQWDSSENIEAKYAGLSSDFDVSGNEYLTTEPGTFMLKGNFSNLTIDLEEGGSIEFQLHEGSKDVYFAQGNTHGSSPTKSVPGPKTTSNWISGKDGGFKVPTKMETYKKLGITDPIRSSYDYVDNTSSQFFLKQVVAINYNESNYNPNAIISDVDGRVKRLGETFKVNDFGGKVILYPYFGSRIYRIKSSTNEDAEPQYQDNIKEACEDAQKLNYDTIELLRSVSMDNRNLRDDTYNSNQYYNFVIDPSFKTNVSIELSSPHNITLNLGDNYLQRAGKIQLDRNLNLNVTSSGSGRIEFTSYPAGTGTAISDAGFVVGSESLLQIENNANVSNFYGTTVKLSSNGKLYLLKGSIKSPNAKGNESAVYSESGSSLIIIGDNEKRESATARFANNETIILTNKGYAINTAGELVWMSGIVKTTDITKKQGISYEMGNSKLYIRNSLYPCLSYSSSDSNYNNSVVASNNPASIACQPDEGQWSLTDEDSGSSKTYYASNLQNANNTINLAGNNKFYEIVWREDFVTSDSGSENNAVINKKVRVDFNSLNVTSAFDTSTLKISSNAELKNMNAITRNKTIEVTSTGNVSFINSTIGSARGSNFYTISNNGIIYYNSSSVDSAGLFTRGSQPALYNKTGSKFVFNGSANRESYIRAESDATTSRVVYNDGASFQFNGSKAIVENRNTNVSNYNVIYNTSGGTVEITSGKVKYTAGTSGNGYAITNNDEASKLNICGTANISSNKTALYCRGSATSTSSANVLISGSAVVSGDVMGINLVSAKLQIEQGGSPGVTIESNGYSNGEGVAIKISGNQYASVNVGTYDARIERNYPIINGNSIGIQMVLGSIYAYDGKINGKKQGIYCTSNSGEIYIDGASVKGFGSGTTYGIYNSGNASIKALIGDISGISTGIWNNANGSISVSSGAKIEGRNYGIYNNANGNINITGGNATNGDIIGDQGIWNNGRGTVTINDGKIYGRYYGVYNNSSGSIILNGGTIMGQNNSIINASNGTITINGGTTSPEYVEP